MGGRGPIFRHTQMIFDVWIPAPEMRDLKQYNVCANDNAWNTSHGNTLVHWVLYETLGREDWQILNFTSWICIYIKQFDSIHACVAAANEIAKATTTFAKRNILLGSSIGDSGIKSCATLLNQYTHAMTESPAMRKISGAGQSHPTPNQTCQSQMAIEVQNTVSLFGCPK